MISSPVPIDPAFKYKIEGKDRILQMLSMEIRTFERGHTEIEVVQFQIASTILMLMLQFIERSLEGMKVVVDRGHESKVATAGGLIPESMAFFKGHTSIR